MRNILNKWIKATDDKGQYAEKELPQNRIANQRGGLNT
jgi:hypothetical protein